MKVQNKNFVLLFCLSYHVFVLSCSKNKPKPFGKKFKIGRIPPGKFEYPKLNGFYRLSLAVKLIGRKPVFELHLTGQIFIEKFLTIF